MFVAAPHNDVGGHPIGHELRAAEYTSVRTEWLLSRDAQQHTLQWTLAALAVILAGLLSSGVRKGQPFVFVAIAGLAVAIATFSQAIWFGEVMRMERAALFLRGLERAVSRGPVPAEGIPPLIWERWRGYRTKVRDPLWVSKAAPSIIASFALYGLMAVAGIVLLGYAAADHKLPDGDRSFALAIAITGGLLYLATTAYLGWEAWRIKGVSDKAPALDKFMEEAVRLEKDADETAPARPEPG